MIIGIFGGIVRENLLSNVHALNSFYYHTPLNTNTKYNMVSNNILSSNSTFFNSPLQMKSAPSLPNPLHEPSEKMVLQSTITAKSYEPWLSLHRKL